MLRPVFVCEECGLWVEEEDKIEELAHQIEINVGGDTSAELNKEQVKALVDALNKWLSKEG